MLPLWIIDLREKSDRRDSFENLVGQIDHVFINRNQVRSTGLESKDGECNDNLEGESSELSVVSPIDHFSETKNIENADSETGLLEEQSTAERFEAADKEAADRNSFIEGNYWRYSQMENQFYGVSIHQGNNLSQKRSEYSDENIKSEVEEKATAKGTADRLYKFQSDLVREGQAFIKDLRKSNVHPDLKFNIVVLGDLTEDFTRIFFPSIAGLLQKEKGRILPHHIHQGMEIIGMLYIPSDINTREVNIRKSMQRTLNEIDVQYRINDIRGYDHMMYYQDVQNRTESAYTMLSDKQLSEYLVQCLVHLYLACDESHPLLSGTTSADDFYFSMGATSLYYDTEKEDIKGRRKLIEEFIRNLKTDGDDEKEHSQFVLVAENEYDPESFFNYEVLSKLDCENIAEVEAPSPHPIRDFFTKYLKRFYYNTYLKFFTTNLMQRIVNSVDNATRAALETISTESKKRFSDAQKMIFENLRDMIGQISANDGGLPAIIRAFRNLQEDLSKRRKDIIPVLEQKFWRNAIENSLVGKALKDPFTEYHDAYIHDIKNKTGGSNQLEMKKQAVTELNGILSNESTMLSRICRSVLLGILCALVLVPILNMLSPRIINLGRIYRYRELWSVVLFFVPAICQFISYFRYTRSKNRAVNNLKAMYLHDAYARVANRVETEINSFYDKMIALGDKYVRRCEDIRNELGKNIYQEEDPKPLFPESMFNQPLIGGKFGQDQLLSEKDIDDAEIQISFIRYKLNDLTKVEHFLLINENRSSVMELFKDVVLCENLIRRVKDNGEEELVTKEQQEIELQDAWFQHLEKFNKELQDTVNKAILKRENSTIGEKLYHYFSLSSDQRVVKSMVSYAATNGEVTSSADIEFSDVKTNDKRIEENIKHYLPPERRRLQIDKFNRVYGKYLFVTRWRSFDHLNLNRILPTEDFDEIIRRQMVWDAQKEAEKKEMSKQVKKRTFQKKTHTELDNLEHEGAYSEKSESLQGQNQKEVSYKPKPSSLLLWALCPNDSSPEWFRLFKSEFFAEAYSDKNIYREILNTDD